MFSLSLFLLTFAVSTFLCLQLALWLKCKWHRKEVEYLWPLCMFWAYLHNDPFTYIEFCNWAKKEFCCKTSVCEFIQEERLITLLILTISFDKPLFNDSFTSMISRHVDLVDFIHCLSPLTTYITMRNITHHLLYQDRDISHYSPRSTSEPCCRGLSLRLEISKIRHKPGDRDNMIIITSGRKKQNIQWTIPKLKTAEPKKKKKKAQPKKEY